jgi:hypothetical protein
MKKHGERAHSKFSASGAERWFNCPGSVELSEGQPDKSSPWALEGTQAHEVLEKVLRYLILNGHFPNVPDVPKMMREYAKNAAGFIFGLAKKLEAEVLCEERVYLDFIHPEMFGTYDGAVLDHFGTLHVFDYKYGQGHAVSPKGNLQMVFYAIGLAHKFDWNFKSVRMWIIQPRIKGYDGPMYWELSMRELLNYVEQFEQAVDRVIQFPKEYREGSWCHWCKAKSICPLKDVKKLDKAREVFSVIKT